MPDITLCTSEDCPLKELCFRWTAKPSEYLQSYADFKYNIIEIGKQTNVGCDYFLEDKSLTNKEK